jgi:hypothetical protein
MEALMRYAKQMMQAAGWIVILLFGFLFALLAMFLVRRLPFSMPLHCTACMTWTPYGAVVHMHGSCMPCHA